MVLKGKPRFEETPPDDYDPAHPFADPVARLEQREWLVREKLVKMETAKIIRSRLKACYQQEGVNHYKNCREIVKQYLTIIQDVGWGKDTRILGSTLPKNVGEEES